MKSTNVKGSNIFEKAELSYFGCQTNLHSDKGKKFMSKFLKLEIEKTSKRSQHLQENTMIETAYHVVELCR